MGKETSIRWTDATWNPTTGCTKVSPGCDNCYAEAIAERFRGGNAWPNGFDLQLRPGRLLEPTRWTESKRVFLNSMSDIFHKGIPDYYLLEVWDVMVVKAPWHTYQILTKRIHVAAERIQRLQLPLPPHIWLGVSAENQAMADSRIPVLIDIPAHVRFVSYEPLLGPIDLRAPNDRRGLLDPDHSGGWMSNLHWGITGGESGPRRRPAAVDWFRDIRDQHVAAGVPYFHKQGNAVGPDQDRILDGREWNDMPAWGQDLGVHQLAMGGIR